MLEDLVARLRARPDQRARLIREYAQHTGQPVARVYRHLREAGHGSGRRRRSDAGRTRAPVAELEMLASLQVAAVRQSGQATLHLPVARQILRASGLQLGGLSEAQLARLLRERGIDLGTQRRGRQSHGEVRSTPNELHLVDPSRPLFWYLPTSRRPQRQLADAGYEPYKNKPLDEAARRKLGVWRYVMTDHASGCIRVRYYQIAGENPTTLWDFLCHCWSAGAWHGVPEWLWWDKGSEHAAIGAALAALGVRAAAHAPGNSRAKGSVEKAQRIVETHFESRLPLQPAGSIEEVNRQVEIWADHYNGNEIPGLDTRLRRGGTRAVRLELWQRIGPERLRELPGDGRDLARWQPVTRKVAGNLTISFRHPRRRAQGRYRVAQVSGVRVGQQVTVQPLLDDAGAVLVRSTYQGDVYEERLLPREVDEYGFPVDAAKPGEFKAPARTEVERAGERLRELAGPRRPGEAAFGGQFRAVDAVAGDGKVIPLPRRGREIELPAPAAAAAPLPLQEAARRVMDRLGEAWDPGLLDEIVRRWPRGAPAAELDAWAAARSGDRGMAG